MNTNQPRHEDEPLRALLKEWKAKPSLPPSFQEQVWRATAGWAQARQVTGRVSDDLSARYVRLVNPYQSPR